MENSNNYAPAITATEITDWENRFKQSVSPLVEFEKQDNGQSMKLYSGESGIEANWKGTILLKSDNYINWDFSLQNGPFIDAKFMIDTDNNQLVNKLFSFYQQWREEWSKLLSIPPDAAIETGNDAQAQLKENRSFTRTKESIIRDHSDRMKKLAGF